MEEVFYVKSFREQFDGLQTLVWNDLITTQTTQEIFDTFLVKPNTLSFGRPPRLCTTILDINYVKTYRPQGLIFTLPNNEKPDYVFPFDLNAITENDNPVVEYYQMWNDVHLHYNVKLIDDFMEFAFSSYEDMYHKLKNPSWIIDPEDILTLVNNFRVNKWISLLEPSKKKLVEYNEAIFLRPVRINPVAIFGDKNNEEYQKISHTHNVPHYSSAEDFFSKSTW